MADKGQKVTQISKVKANNQTQSFPRNAPSGEDRGGTAELTGYLIPILCG